jgi:RPA family protein
MPDQQYKRNTAYKFRIGELLLGKPIFDQERFSFLELGDKKIIRINIIGNIVEKFENSREGKYLFFTIDDGSGQMRIKVFGDDVERYKYFSQGQTIVVIGVLRNWNDETYINPEIIREMDSRYLLIRKLEIEKDK